MSDSAQEIEQSMHAIELYPSLKTVVEANSLDAAKLTVGLKLNGEKPDTSCREEVLLHDGEKGALWRVESLRGLFRGDKPAPTGFHSGPTPAYVPMFYYIEGHILTFCEGMGNKTDGEFEEAYSNLRRRPDGRSMSELHFFIWQVAAGLLGTRVLSAAEFDTIFGRLAQSARAFRIGHASRNYITTLQSTVGRR